MIFNKIHSISVKPWICLNVKNKGREMRNKIIRIKRIIRNTTITFFIAHSILFITDVQRNTMDILYR
jgi:hypothetical protein